MKKGNRPAVLFLSQRLPFPPNKGEKISSFNIVRHLGRRFDVHVGTFVDNPQDLAEIERFRPFCRSLHVEPITKPWAWLRAMPRWLGGLPLSFALFRSAALGAYVRDVIVKYQPAAIIAHSSNIAEYALASTAKPTLRVFDFVDVDSEKFFAYAAQAKGWKRWLLTLEAQRVRAEESRLAACADIVAFVSNEEAALFCSTVDVPSTKVVTIANGVDTEAFDPNRLWPRPVWGDGPAFVFTGAMDYQPNIDSVVWFADAVLPAVRAAHSQAQFVIVGSNPTRAVKTLAIRPGVLVTGAVPDIQPYLAHAFAVVAPLRIARGIQNKVLEALAMGRPTIVSSGALTGIGAADTTPVIVADGDSAWIAACLQLFNEPDTVAALKARGRSFVIEHFSWDERLRVLDSLLP
jgi:sugar transferase (PEP-CTERM/EpsH1 system associated)